MGAWTHIVLEGYCMCDISHKKKMKWCKIEDVGDLFKNKKNIKWEVQGNPSYIDAKKPKWCKNKPMYQCLSKNCPFFAYANAEKKVYKKIDELYNDNET